MKFYNKHYFYIFFLSTIMSFHNFSVSPMRVDFESEPGETEQRAITIVNPGQDSVDIIVYTKDFMRINGKEVEVKIDNENFDRSCSRWMTITPTKFTLDANQIKKIRVGIAVPDSAIGDYWTRLYVEEASKPKPQSYKRGDKTLNISANARWGVNIESRVPGERNKLGKINKIEIASKDSIKNISFDFENISSVILRCKKSKIEIRDQDGKTIKILLIDEFHTYPNETRTIAKKILNNNFEVGEYSAVVIIDYQGKQLAGGEALFEINK